MSDEKEAAVRCAAEALWNWRTCNGPRDCLGTERGCVHCAPGDTEGQARIALDAAGVWERIEELERERDAKAWLARHWAQAHEEAHDDADSLRADNGRLRAELQQRDAEWGELAADNERLREARAWAERVRSLVDPDMPPTQGAPVPPSGETAQ